MKAGHTEAGESAITDRATGSAGGAAHPPSKRLTWLLLAAVTSAVASGVVGIVLADRQGSPRAAPASAWHGKVTKIARSGPSSADRSGLGRVAASGVTPIVEGEAVSSGARFATDERTRARLELEDGTAIVLDRSTEVELGREPRTLTVVSGAILADVSHLEGAPPARVSTANGDVLVLGTKINVTASSDRTNVEVLRGEVEVTTSRGSHRILAGQEGVSTHDGRVDVAPANDLARRAAFGESVSASSEEEADAPEAGLGELRAKRPGRTDEKDRAVRLQNHAVKVRIAGNVARTEIDETFANDTDDELEGIYRFPLPPGARIERLALEVDGKLLDGEFVEKGKAAAIWRGAIRNAAPTAPKPKEEIVWVPGPWHDPALLEWQRGGRFELRIFPIPKRGSRRVVIAYTETIAPASGIRRYVYPLPQGTSSKISIDHFSVDARVVGNDPTAPVRVRGYELAKSSDGEASSFTTSASAFAPAGDLAIEYGLDDARVDATAWAYRAPPVDTSPAKPADPIGNDPFVAIALRPKLPKWTEPRPRDQVIVVDVGRTMYGERFARARRLAARMTQEMDRKDRVTILACDVSCRPMTGGFVAPGAPSAHDVDAFLRGVTPDGASDLVGAIRTAASLDGHGAERDLRITLLSGGVATAGYQSAARVPVEVSEAVATTRALVVAVPIGADADVDLLANIARGGGGVVVPYQAGQRLEASALEVLNATYGTTLRDVEVVLPEGLHQMAPRAVAPLRAGSETIVTARMSGDSVKGDVVLRGKVGGEAFEARYPIELHAGSDPGNAFVPRLFAAARITERERDPGEGSRAELVALSRRFSIPSRVTSLLVLESEAMFSAFGIDRAAHGPQWTGEVLARGSVAASAAPTRDDSDELSSYEDSSSEAKQKKSAALGAAESGPEAASTHALPSAPRAASRAAPAPSSPAAPPPPAKAAAPFDERSPIVVDREFDDAWRRPSGGRFMKKIWVRHAAVSADGPSTVTMEKVAAARSAALASPDERTKRKELARWLAASGRLDELGETLEAWSLRDPLDADAIVARSDLAARRGDRASSLRILGGALAGNGLSASESLALIQAIGRSYERLGKPEACAFDVSAAELRPSSPDLLARAVTCERTHGKSSAAERWLVGMEPSVRRGVDAALAKGIVGEAPTGDLVVAATWSGGADLDLSVVDPSGRRAGAVGRSKVRIEGATSRDHETLALSSNDAGPFVVEIVRTDVATSNEGSHASTSGTVTLKAFGQSRSFPFVLSGARAAVGRIDVRWDAELVPVDAPPTIGTTPTFPLAFDRSRAAGALASVSLSHCRDSGQVGTGHVTVTFAPTGRVSEVVVDDANFDGTAAGRCVQSAFYRASVTPFSGSTVRIGKSFTLGALR